MKTKRKKISIADIMIKVILGIIALISLFPFYQTLLISLSKEGDKFTQTIFLYPVHIDISAYTYLLKEGKVVSGLLVTLFITVVGTCLSMAISIPAAYALSKKKIPGRNILMNLIIFTMYFSGGLVPYFITIKNLGLMDNILVMILPNAVNTFNLILLKNFFKDLPQGLEESAKIDGASDFRILLQIVIPISKPIIAAISLFYAVDRWNEWYNGMLFISDSKKYPLQLVLRNAIVNMSTLLKSTAALDKAAQLGNAYSESVKNAIIVIAAVPIIMVYPFVQKYFASGIMIGSIKE
jgi:putative aldouronate transport system permease protein